MTICGAHMTTGTSGLEGYCTQQESYACGSDTYEVDCTCSMVMVGGACECKKNGATVQTLHTPDCPCAMNSPSSLLCGFPQ